MKILLTHAYSRENKGDAAILSVLLTQVKKAFPSASVKISTLEDVTVLKEFDGVPTIPSFLYFAHYSYKNVVAKLAYSIYIAVATLFWACLWRIFKINLQFLMTKPIRTVANEFLETDMIIPIGGGYLRAKPGMRETVNFMLLLHPILLAFILKKPVVLYSQSIGPFFNGAQSSAARFILNRVNLILVREDHTLKTLHDIGVKNNHIIRTVDAGFLFQPDKSFSLTNVIPANKLKGKMLVGITVRRWMTKEKQEKYEKAVASFIDRAMVSKNIIFIFIPQVSSKSHNDDDRDVAKRILTYIKNKNQVINLDGEYTHQQVKSFYSSLDFIVGTRFHSVIFSLTAYVPAVAIEYEYKTSGIMKDLHLSEWVISIEDVTDDILYDKFQKLLKDVNKYKKTLKVYLPGYIRQAEKNVTYLKNASQEKLSNNILPS